MALWEPSSRMELMLYSGITQKYRQKKRADRGGLLPCVSLLLNNLLSPRRTFSVEAGFEAERFRFMTRVSIFIYALALLYLFSLTRRSQKYDLDL